MEEKFTVECVIQLPNDRMIIGRFGVNDYQLHMWNGDYAVRGTFADIFKEAAEMVTISRVAKICDELMGLTDDVKEVPMTEEEMREYEEAT